MKQIKKFEDLECGDVVKVWKVKYRGDLKKKYKFKSPLKTAIYIAIVKNSNKKELLIETIKKKGVFYKIQWHFGKEEIIIKWKELSNNKKSRKKFVICKLNERERNPFIKRAILENLK